MFENDVREGERRAEQSRRERLLRDCLNAGAVDQVALQTNEIQAITEQQPFKVGAKVRLKTDPEVRGTIRSLSNKGTAVVDWSHGEAHSSGEFDFRELEPDDEDASAWHRAASEM